MIFEKIAEDSLRLTDPQPPVEFCFTMHAHLQVVDQRQSYMLLALYFTLLADGNEAAAQSIIARSEMSFDRQHREATH